MNTLEKKWSPIKGYEGLYEISSHGEVRAYANFGGGKLLEPRIKKLTTNKVGYILTSLWKDGKYKTYLVHRLVAEHFVPNIMNNPQVNHINGIKGDNHIENLEWVTAKDNINHALIFGLNKTIGETHHQAKLTASQVKRIRLMKEIDPKLTITRIGKMFGLHHGTISRIWLKRSWKCLN